jgi:hypothetical protein
MADKISKIAKAFGLSKPLAKQKLAKAKKEGGLTLIELKTKKVKQTKLGKKSDASRDALPSGKRISRTGKVYTERRSNRVD